MQYFPSKKIIVLMIGMVVMGGFWFVFGKDGTKTSGVTGEDVTQFVAENSQTYIDSDNDGLADWEEQLFKTDPNNPDSDGDGILDGEEFVSLKNIAEIQPTDDALNYINQIGEYLAQAEGGNNPTLPEATLRLFPDYYTNSAVTKVETTSNSINAYFTVLLIATKPYESESGETTLDILSRWIEVGDPADKKLLAQKSEKLKKSLVLLGNAPVPSNLVGAHMDLVNHTYHVALSLDEALVTRENPQAQLFAAAKYANYQTKRSNSIISLTRFYNSFVSNLAQN